MVLGNILWWYFTGLFINVFCVFKLEIVYFDMCTLGFELFYSLMDVSESSFFDLKLIEANGRKDSSDHTVRITVGARPTILEVTTTVVGYSAWNSNWGSTMSHS